MVGPKTQSSDWETSQFVVRNCGGGCNKSSDVKPKNNRCENERIERKVEVKTRYFSATAGAPTKKTSDSSMLETHLKATIKFDQTVDCFNN